jgi:hypothetical protein
VLPNFRTELDARALFFKACHLKKNHRSQYIRHYVKKRHFSIIHLTVSKTFSSPPRPERLWGPPSLLSNGYWGGGFSLGVKRPGREADHSPPSSAEVKNAWNYTSTLTDYVFMAWCLVKHRDNFTLTFTVLKIKAHY